MEKAHCFAHPLEAFSLQAFEKYCSTVSSCHWNCNLHAPPHSHRQDGSGTLHPLQSPGDPGFVDLLVCKMGIRGEPPS
jgi:hypothetical protein